MEKSNGNCFGLVHQLREFQFAQEANKRGDSSSEKYHDMIARLAANRERNHLRMVIAPTAAESEKK